MPTDEERDDIIEVTEALIHIVQIVFNDDELSSGFVMTQVVNRVAALKAGVVQLEETLRQEVTRADDLQAKLDRASQAVAALAGMVRQLPHLKPEDTLAFWPDLGLALAEAEASVP